MWMVPSGNSVLKALASLVVALSFSFSGIESRLIGASSLSLSGIETRQRVSLSASTLLKSFVFLILIDSFRWCTVFDASMSTENGVDSPLTMQKRVSEVLVMEM